MAVYVAVPFLYRKSCGIHYVRNLPSTLKVKIVKNVVKNYQVAVHALVHGQTLVAEILCETDKGANTGKIEFFTGNAGVGLSTANGNIVTVCLAESCFSAVLQLLQSNKAVQIHAGHGEAFPGLSCV